MGLPGSGKSTTLSKFAENHGYEYIALDQIREKLGITNAQPSTKDVLDEIVSRTLEKYGAGCTVVLDGTFLNDMRKNFIEVMRAHGVGKIQGLFIDVPEDIAWERLQAREKDWEDKTTRELFDTRLRHRNEFPPSVTDGFDSLLVLNERGELSKVELASGNNQELKVQKRFL